MTERLIKPSKKYNLTFQKHVVSLQPKAISRNERNKSPPLAEAILPKPGRMAKQIRKDNSDCLKHLSVMESL
jgi:hypothetical protein